MTDLNSNLADLESRVREALRAIIDPDLGKDIVSLGFIKDLTCSPDGEMVSLTLELTTPACPVKETFREQASLLIQGLGVRRVEVHLSSAPRRRPVLEGTEGSGLDTVKSIVAVSSCKGGVGKSTAAALLAAEISSQGYRVGLLDLDIFGPSLPTLFGVSLKGVPARDRKLQPYDFHITNKEGLPPLKLMSFGFLLGDSPAIMRGPMVSNYIQQLLHQVEWGELDYLFIDMPPGTGDTQITVSQSARLDGAVIVTTPQTLSLVDVARGILMYEKVNVPILGIVENMSYFICTNCQDRHHPFSEEGIQGLQERFGTPLLAQLPFLPMSQVSFRKYQSFAAAKELADQTVREIGKQTVERETLPEISFDNQEISLAWKNKRLTVRNFTLRNECPCALCVDEFTGERKLQSENIPPDISPVRAVPLGNYALSVEWSDGHSSGIYPYKLIEKLGEVSG